MDPYREPTFGGFPRATVRSMIDRFRHGEPMSRAERERTREDNGQQSPEFWWRVSDPGSGAPSLHDHHRRSSIDGHHPVAAVRTHHENTRCARYSLGRDLALCYVPLDLAGATPASRASLAVVGTETHCSRAAGPPGPLLLHPLAARIRITTTTVQSCTTTWRRRHPNRRSLGSHLRPSSSPQTLTSPWPVSGESLASVMPACR